MDPVAVTASTSTTSTTTSSPSASKSETAAKQSFETLFAAAKNELKAGETLTKVKRHEFARIHGGERDDMCVNLSGNGRNGEAFDLITRGGHTFHVYGSGKDRVVVEVGRKATSGGTQAS